MKKYISIFTLMFIFSTYAQQNAQQKEEDIFKKDEKAFFINGEFLYWTVDEGAIDYAISQKEVSTSGFAYYLAKGDVKKFIENTEEVLEIYKEIETCINRVNDKYPDIRHEITKETIEMYRDKVLSHINILIEWDEHTQIGVS